MKFIEKIFSVKNHINHKIVTILGIKLKFFSNKLANKNLLKRLENSEKTTKQLIENANILRKCFKIVLICAIFFVRGKSANEIR